MNEKYNLFYFFKRFPDEDACRNILKNADGIIIRVVRIAVMHKRYIAIKMAKHSNPHIVINSSRLRHALYSRTQICH